MTNFVKNNESISENIANLLNSAPSGFHDDDEIDETSAKLLSATNEDFVGVPERSKIRTENAPLLENIDKKYAGKIASRKALSEFSDKSDSEESEKNELEGTDDEENSSIDDEEIEDEEIEEYDSQESEEEEEDATNFKTFKETDVNEQKRKGISVRNQLNLWENLLEMRIQLQKCLAASNRLPIEDNFKQLLQSEDYRNKLNDTKQIVGNTLDKMIDLQKLLIQKYPETKKLLSNKQADQADDEEITSESEPEEEPEPSPPKKRRKIQELEEIISKRHDLYKNYRNNTIQKWNDKTRIGTLTKNTNSHTILNQIEHILMNKSKLIKKSQLKRSNYQILGENETEDGEEIYNENIYDDDDFYHQLLKELIEFKSSDVTDPVQLGRQWIKLQNMRSKMKRKIDTRATKGRKIRYAVHTKLVNFMAPIEYRNTWTEEAKNEIFGSLFGKKQL